MTFPHGPEDNGDVTNDFSNEATCNDCGAPVCNHVAATLSALASESPKEDLKMTDLAERLEGE